MAEGWLGCYNKSYPYNIHEHKSFCNRRVYPYARAHSSSTTESGRSLRIFYADFYPEHTHPDNNGNIGWRNFSFHDCDNCGWSLHRMFTHSHKHKAIFSSALAHGKSNLDPPRNMDSSSFRLSRQFRVKKNAPESPGGKSDSKGF